MGATAPNQHPGQWTMAKRELWTDESMKALTESGIQENKGLREAARLYVRMNLLGTCIARDGPDSSYLGVLKA